jgi:phage baseplate assembly protein W
MASGFSVKLPLMYDNEDGPYLLTKTLAENIKQNFKHLILTNPGERLMEPDFGVGFSRILFENYTSETIEELQGRLYEQTAKYLPFVNIRDVKTSFEDHVLHVQISYIIESLKISDAITVDLTQK